jgi:hypothetical protein
MQKTEHRSDSLRTVSPQATLAQLVCLLSGLIEEKQAAPCNSGEGMILAAGRNRTKGRLVVSGQLPKTLTERQLDACSDLPEPQRRTKCQSGCFPPKISKSADIALSARRRSEWEKAMKRKSHSAGKPEDAPNLGQKNASLEKDKDAELARMGERTREAGNAPKGDERS